MLLSPFISPSPSSPPPCSRSLFSIFNVKKFQLSRFLETLEYVPVIFNNASPSGGTNFKLQAERSYRVLTIIISYVLSAFSFTDTMRRTTAGKSKSFLCNFKL